MADLFETAGAGSAAPRPLADRLRPQTLAEVIGQQQVLGPDAPLGVMLASGSLSSLILWGPPGVGKTTIARLLADETEMDFIQISAIFTGVADLKKVFETARQRRRAGMGTLLFVDEIHRFNKAQQDGFLPHMEDGTILLVGATTENPSFELNAALLSRAQVLVLERLGGDDMERLLERAETELSRELPLTPDARDALREMADGDGRALLNLVEQIAAWTVTAPLDREALSSRLMRRAAKYDKSGEDIGLADPQAQGICLEAWQVYERLGSPEGELALAQALVYLALAPKSNATYVAYKGAMALAKKTGSAMPPKHILNAPTGMMKDQGYGADYAYDHNAEDGFSGQNYFPDGVPRPDLYQPVERGFERDLKKRVEYFQKLRTKRGGA